MYRMRLFVLVRLTDSDVEAGGYSPAVLIQLCTTWFGRSHIDAGVRVLSLREELPGLRLLAVILTNGFGACSLVLSEGLHVERLG